MRFQLNIEFDSMEEFLAFSKTLQSAENPAPTKLEETKALKKIRKFNENKTVHPINIPPAKGFRLTDDLLQKVQKFLDSGESFHTSEIIGKKGVENAKRRTAVNQWLKSFPQLTYGFVKFPGSGGRGRLMFNPVRADGKVFLPKGAKPTKSDWPIKGAAIRKSIVPIEIPDDEEFTISESSNN